MKHTHPLLAAFAMALAMAIAFAFTACSSTDAEDDATNTIVVGRNINGQWSCSIVEDGHTNDYVFRFSAEGSMSMTVIPQTSPDASRSVSGIWKAHDNSVVATLDDGTTLSFISSPLRLLWRRDGQIYKLQCTG